MSKVERTVASTKPDLEFAYNSAGQRIMKKEIPKNGDRVKYTWYVNDATGNTLTIYETHDEEEGGQVDRFFYTSEQLIYASSRLGAIHEKTMLAKAVYDIGTGGELTYNSTEDLQEMPGEIYTMTLGRKLYELSNHLGNVHTVVNDRKIPVPPSGTNLVISYFTPEVIHLYDYYPFGSPMPGRSYGAQLEECSSSSSVTNSGPTVSVWNPYAGGIINYTPAMEVTVNATGDGAYTTIGAPPPTVPTPGVTVTHEYEVEVEIEAAYADAQVAVYDPLGAVMAGPFIIPPGGPASTINLDFMDNGNGNYQLRVTGDAPAPGTFKPVDLLGVPPQSLPWVYNNLASGAYDFSNSRQDVTVNASGDGASLFFTTPSTGEQVDVSFTVEVLNNDAYVEVIPQSGTPYNITVFAGSPPANINHSFNSFGSNCEIRVTSLPNPGPGVYPDNIYVSQLTAVEQVPVSSNLVNISLTSVNLKTTTTTTTCVSVEEEGYRWGFNGQERDDEVSGTRNSYTAEYWEYDPRLGRRWNMDPIIKMWESPFAAFHNNPNIFVDPLGLDPPKHRNAVGSFFYGAWNWLKGDSYKTVANKTALEYEKKGYRVDVLYKKDKNGREYAAITGYTSSGKTQKISGDELNGATFHFLSIDIKDKARYVSRTETDFTLGIRGGVVLQGGVKYGVDVNLVSVTQFNMRTVHEWYTPWEDDKFNYSGIWSNAGKEGIDNLQMSHGIEAGNYLAGFKAEMTYDFDPSGKIKVQNLNIHRAYTLLLLEFQYNSNPNDAEQRPARAIGIGFGERVSAAGSVGGSEFFGIEYYDD